jgi:hypothetical protein
MQGAKPGTMTRTQSFLTTYRRLIDGLIVLACIACVAAGFALYNTCDGGNALILFGGAIAFLGALLFRLGAWAVSLPLAIATLALIGGGYYGVTVAGCAW